MSTLATATGLIAQLRGLRSERDIAGQRRFGITPKTEQLGVSMVALRAMARPHRRDHLLARALWAAPIQEARVLAALIEDPEQITRAQMDRWVRALDNWALTDAVAFVFDRTPFAVEKAHEWSERSAEFEKRAAFSVMAGLAVHRKELADDVFLDLLPVIAREAVDERNFVRKAVNWALRQIGKRNALLRRAAIAEAKRIQKLDSRSARWIASDALRELDREKLRAASRRS
jgi:3-methyladenine DNA glycosylase AlkD